MSNEKITAFKKMMGIQKECLEKCFAEYEKISPLTESIKINIISMFGAEWRKQYEKGIK